MLLADLELFFQLHTELYTNKSNYHYKWPASWYTVEGNVMIKPEVEIEISLD